MADEETNIEEVEETPVVADVQPEAVEETVVETVAVEEAAVDEAAVEEVAVEESAIEASAAEPEPAVEAAVAAPAGKKAKSQRHVPRAERRKRTVVKREPAAPRKPITRVPKLEEERAARQERRGVVVSDKTDKTIVVKVEVTRSHPRYKKVVRRSVKFHAHDERNEAGIGDTVRIVETRPLSKTKRWRLVEIVEKAR